MPSVNDTITATYTVTALVAERLASVNNTVTATYSVSILIAERVPVVSQTITITESVSVRLIIPGITVSDTITISESNNLLAVLARDSWRPIMRPDGDRMLACRTLVGDHDSATGFDEMELWEFSTDGSGATRVKNAPSIEDVTWVSYGHPEYSPDSTEVIIWVETTTGYLLQYMDDTFANTTVLRSVTGTDYLKDPSYSSDGTKITFVEKSGSSYQIRKATNLDTTPVFTTLTSSSNILTDPYFSPDDSQIVYVEITGPVDGPHPFGQWSLKLVDSTGGTPTTVLDDGNINIHPCWLDDDELIFQRFDYDAPVDYNVARIHTDGSDLLTVMFGEYPRVVNV